MEGKCAGREKSILKGLEVRNSVIRKNLEEMCGEIKRGKRGKYRTEHGRP